MTERATGRVTVRWIWRRFITGEDDISDSPLNLSAKIPTTSKGW